MAWLREQWRRDALWMCAILLFVPYMIVFGLLAYVDRSAQAGPQRAALTGSAGRPLEARGQQGTRGGPLARPAASCEALQGACGEARTPRIGTPTNAPR